MSKLRDFRYRAIKDNDIFKVLISSADKSCSDL
jgi:hypothetical protein